MLEEHISSKYLETLSYNLSIKVIFIFAFIGNRMDLFYFHTEKNIRSTKPSMERLFSGVISFDKTKNKTHQCNGNFSSFRISSFLSLRLYRILPCHCAFLFFGWSVARVEGFFLRRKETTSERYPKTQKMHLQYLSPLKWRYYVNDNVFYTFFWNPQEVDKTSEKGLMTSPTYTKVCGN